MTAKLWETLTDEQEAAVKAKQYGYSVMGGSTSKPGQVRVQNSTGRVAYGRTIRQAIETLDPLCSA